jgi:hypothetical protein
VYGWFHPAVRRKRREDDLQQAARQYSMIQLSPSRSANILVIVAIWQAVEGVAATTGPSALDIQSPATLPFPVRSVRAFM